jgi:RNA polymerase sigma-70 factor, ECF subfamily
MATMTAPVQPAAKDVPARTHQRAGRELTAHDEDLLLAARAGSHAAFADLQRMYAPRLYKRILSITRNREDAEDALQDTFLHAYRGLPSFEARSQFSTWLTRIAINSALLMIRRRRTRPEIPLEFQSNRDDHFTIFDVQDSALDPEQLCDQKQRSQAILRSIKRLDPKLRTPIRIWMSREHSMKEIAESLGVSLAAVKARLHRARKSIGRTQARRNQKAGLNVSKNGGSAARVSKDAKANLAA